MSQHQSFLLDAIALAKSAKKEKKGGPFGAVIVKDGEVIGRSGNRVYINHDPTAHAEIEAIRDACRRLKSRRLDGCVLYSSCEPCPMCFSALYFARIERVIFAASHQDAGEIAGFGMEGLYQELSRPVLERELGHEQLLREEGLEVFWGWVRG